MIKWRNNWTYYWEQVREIQLHVRDVGQESYKQVINKCAHSCNENMSCLSTPSLVYQQAMVLASSSCELVVFVWVMQFKVTIGSYFCKCCIHRWMDGYKGNRYLSLVLYGVIRGLTHWQESFMTLFVLGQEIDRQEDWKMKRVGKMYKYFKSILIINQHVDVWKEFCILHN